MDRHTAVEAEAAHQHQRNADDAAPQADIAVQRPPGGLRDRPAEHHQAQPALGLVDRRPALRRRDANALVANALADLRLGVVEQRQCQRLSFPPSVVDLPVLFSDRQQTGERVSTRLAAITIWRQPVVEEPALLGLVPVQVLALCALETRPILVRLLRPQVHAIVLG